MFIGVMRRVWKMQKNVNHEQNSKKKFGQAYNVALENGWLDEYVWFENKKGEKFPHN